MVFGSFLYLYRLLNLHRPALRRPAYPPRRAGRAAGRLCVIGVVATLALPVVGVAQTTALPVVASFSILGDMVRQIGGDHVSVTTIVGPNGDAHAFEPTPKDARALAHARLLFINGLSFEGWLPRLKKAAGFKGVTIVASKRVVPRTLSDEEMAAVKREDHAEHLHEPARTVDPHAWQRLDNGLIYAQNIAAGLAQDDR